MGFINRLSSGVREQQAKLKAASERRRKEAEARERARVRQEMTKLARERKKIAARKTLYDERTAANQERAAMIRARREAGIVTTGERLDRAGRELGKQAGSALGALFKATNKAISPPKRRYSRPMRTKDGKFARRREW